MQLTFNLHNYRYFPYENALARKEVEILFRKRSYLSEESIVIDAPSKWEALALRTTYFREISAVNGKSVVPIQALLEASSNGGLQETMPGVYLPPNLKRQSTRYSAHGLHEYRGKFNPQLVRTIGNLLGLKSDSWILDPFCGSGTTLLESAHIGWNAIGLDVNPLAVEIARAKLAAVQVKTKLLINYSDELKQRLTKSVRDICFDKAFKTGQIRELVGSGWENLLPNIDYLKAWFSESVLVQLALILRYIENVQNRHVRLIFQIIFSDILRDVSLQDPDDLRIRRRKNAPANMPAIPMFIDALSAKLATILKARRILPNLDAYNKAFLGDVRSGKEIIANYFPKILFDAAITSPPYVTALPYIDTQRLSLVMLGLLDADEIRTKERMLIGNREISNSVRTKLETSIDANSDKLPSECISLCRELKTAVATGTDGFRRQNMPALVYQYFKDMGLMFSSVNGLLKKNAPFVLVVGKNRTKLNGKDFLIDTPELLSAVARGWGFTLDNKIELDTYHRYNIHRLNSINAETMLMLRRDK